MKADYLVGVDEFCANHNIETTFINTLQVNGLIEVTTIKEAVFVNSAQLKQLEKIVRLYYELDINLEGIETINYLLKRISCLQDEVLLLRNTLSIYESDL